MKLMNQGLSKAEKSVPSTTPDWQAAVRRRMRFYVLIAILLAGLFGFLVYQFFYQQQSIPTGEFTSGLFAGETIPGGTVLTKEMLEVKKVPIQALPPDHLQFKEQVVGLLTLYPLVEGEAILPAKLAQGLGSALAHRCPPQKWCLSIPTAWFAAPPPELAEGDWVEIVSALPGRSQKEAGFIATRVLIVRIAADNEVPSFVLAVDNQEAINILHARVNEFQLLVLLRPAGG